MLKGKIDKNGELYDQRILSHYMKLIHIFLYIK